MFEAHHLPQLLAQLQLWIGHQVFDPRSLSRFQRKSKNQIKEPFDKVKPAL